MKVDRRSFLGLGLGAAAGVAVAPATWKITDDLSIWTQNWPWTPVPRDGEVAFNNSVCSICPGHCGISVRSIDGRPVKIEGREGYPINEGGVCLHGISALQYLYDPSRVKQPMKKNGDVFEPVTWDDAISLVAEKLNTLRNNGNAAKIACLTDGAKGTVSGLFQRLMQAIGSNAVFEMETMDLTWAKLMETMHGLKANAGFDLANSDYVLSFGAGLIEGWGSPVSNFKANASRKERKATLVQVEPRLSNTAANADQWVAAKPGTEAVLALGICNILIAGNHYNKEYVSANEKGFEAFAAMLKSDYGTDKVAEITGVSATAIVDIAKAFAKAAAPVAIAGKGRGNTAGSLREFAAVHALNCLVGNINKEGGVWLTSPMDYDTWPALEMDEIASAAPEGAGIDGVTSATALFKAIAAADQSPVEALLVYNANPAYAMADTKTVKAALDKIPFIVSFSPFMDETAQQADVILPSHTFLELLADVPGTAGGIRPIIGLAKPVAGPVFDTNNPGDSVIGLAAAMEGTVASSFPWETYDECLETIMADNWDALMEEGFVQSDPAVIEDAVTTDFTLLASAADSVQAEGDAGSFPYILVPVDNMRIIATLADSPFSIKTVSDLVLKGKDGFIEINPATASELKVAQGDYVMVSTPKGEAKVKVHLFEGIMPGVIAMTRGLGHSLGENRYVGGKGININELMGPVADAVTGFDAAWGIRAQVSRA